MVRRRVGRQRGPAHHGGFAGATQFVRPEDTAGSIPCGPDLDAIVEAVSEYWKAGFTDIALVQVGDEGQDRFLDEAAGPLLEKLRAAAGDASAVGEIGLSPGPDG